MELKLAQRAGHRPRCSFCRSDDGAPLTPCPSCQLALHEACWQELGTCPTIGCDITADAACAPLLERVTAQHCGYCGEAPHALDSLSNCWACGLAIHLSCWDARERCPTEGCEIRSDEILGVAFRGGFLRHTLPERDPPPLWSDLETASTILWLALTARVLIRDGAVTEAGGSVIGWTLCALLLFNLVQRGLRAHPWHGSFVTLGAVFFLPFGSSCVTGVELEFSKMAGIGAIFTVSTVVVGGLVYASEKLKR